MNLEDTCRQAITAVIEEFAQWRRRSRPTRLLAVDRVQRLIDEYTQGAEQRSESRCLYRHHLLAKTNNQSIVIPYYNSWISVETTARNICIHG